MNGYEALRERAAWVDVSGRGKIRATGEDRARLLHAMTTNEVKALKPGEGCYAFFLSAQGRMLADVTILCRDEDLLLETEPELRSKIYEHLDKFIIADDVTLEDVTDSTATFVLEGPQADQALVQAGAIIPGAEYSHAAWQDWLVVRMSLAGSAHGFLLIGPAGQRPAILDGIAEADLEALTVVRLENGKPRYGEDLGERYLVQETGQMQAVSFQKGCYLGQEIVERVRSRAQIHRRLLPLKVEGTMPPPAGTKFQLDGKDIAEVTSSVYSPAAGSVLALAYVRIDGKSGDALTSGDLHATIV